MVRRLATEWEADESFDRYARLVCGSLGVPVSIVSIVEPTRQVFPGALGLPEPHQTLRETPLSHSFCQYVVADGCALVVRDAREDERLRDNLAIRDLDVIAYAGYPLTDGDGTVIGSLAAIHSTPHEWTEAELATLRDLAAACSTELAQRDLAASLTDMVEHLERSNGRLMAFAGQVSHDLRSPLAGMASSLEMLDDMSGLDGSGENQVRFLLERAQRSTTRMATLVASVFEFARVGGRLHLKPVDVATVVAAAWEDVHPGPGARLDVVGVLDDVVADDVQLHLVLQNLLGNAVKYAPGSPIELSTRIDTATNSDVDGDGDTWTLCVVDHGPGIAADERVRVLDSFVRLDTSVPGAGLGLATCRQAVEAHGGEIVMEATPGGGTTVRLTLPLVDQLTPERSPS
ncbi:MAG: sensor signal transduction histidine kinase [Nocardioides sp.]|nr:sensor signal transduction histidine kinase [Nocardioides sp.]